VRSSGVDAIRFWFGASDYAHDELAIHDPAVARIAEIVHDLDLKDDKFGAPEAATLGIAIDGLQLSSMDDGVLLDQGMTLFEALYRSFGQSIRPSRPRSAGTRKHKGSRAKR